MNYPGALTETHIRDLRIFHLILESGNWEDYKNTEDRLLEGEHIKPEAEREIVGKRARLVAQLHSPIQMISLRISDKADNGRFLLHFFYSKEPERILEWMVKHSEELDSQNFEDYLPEVLAYSDMTILHLANYDMYELKASPNGGKELVKDQL